MRQPSRVGNEGDVTHLVNVGQDTTPGNGGSDQQVKLLVSSNGQLQVSRGDSLHSEILSSVTWGQRGTALTLFNSPASSRTSAVKYSRMAAT